MRKITNFIVNKRYFVISIFTILTLLSLFWGTKVNINNDFSKYLPDDSETRRGMNIMEDNFEKSKNSSLYVMFKDLNEDEKKTILSSLEMIDGVFSVDYDDNAEYNVNNNTLYILNVDDTDDSEVAKKIYSNIQESYKDYKVYCSGSIADANRPVLSHIVVVIAIASATLILIIMCNSYIEPFLFLFTIGIGVILNKGTNLIFSSVSNITDSISSILQIALSMDYSIMLMNRYMQEKECEKNKIKAMKEALFSSFSSISSSSITTIVGLLVLVFMSFTIGRDLGFILAKGVLFSLLSIFFVLPGLILMFDNIITKTKKKSLNFSLNKLGCLSYKLRYVGIIIFVFLFIISYFLKNTLTILYTNSEADEVKKVFKENNQIVVIYNNKYEEIVGNYCRDLIKRDNPNISQVLCYGNTLNDDLSYNDLRERLKNYSSNINIDDRLLKILYYNYYNENTGQMLTLDNLVSFIQSDILYDGLMSDYVDDNIFNSINQLSYFSNSEKINTRYSANELAIILGIRKSNIDNLLTYYNSQGNTTTMSLPDFVKYINSDVFTDDTYSDMIDKNMREYLNLLLKFTDKYFIINDADSGDLASAFGIDEASVKELMLLYHLSIENFDTMTLQDFIIATSYLKENSSYLDSVDVSGITDLLIFAENDINNTRMDKIYLSQLFNGISPELVDQVYSSLDLPDEYLLAPTEFIDLLLNSFKPYLSETQVSNLNILSLVMTDTNTEYDASSLASLLGLEKENIINIYVLNDYIINSSNWKISPYILVRTIMDNKENELIKTNMDIDKINLLYNIMNGVINENKYDYNQMSNLLEIDVSNLKLLYSLYDIKHNNKVIKVSLKSFINFINNDVLTNTSFKSQFSDSDKVKINSISSIINDTLDNKAYSKDEMYSNLSILNSDLNKNVIDLIYVYYGSQNNYNDEWTLSVEKFINYINDNILSDTYFNEFFDDVMVSSISNSIDVINDSKVLLVNKDYSRMIINTTYDDEGEETFGFIQSIKDTLKSENEEIFVIGNSPMAYDISESFNNELNFITILTIISIFVVISITFKSLMVPLILVLVIQCAVFITMSILSLCGGSVYFIALLIVQSILMGATIDYAILYTSYYRESRKTMEVKSALINAYNKSIHTILTSSSILIIVTLIVGNFASAIASKICKTISEGTFYSLLLILLILPSILALFDKYVEKNK